MGVSFVVLLQVAMMLMIRELSENVQSRIELINYLDEIDYASRYRSLHVVVAVVAVEMDTIVVGMSFYTRKEAGEKETRKMKPGRKR